MSTLVASLVSADTMEPIVNAFMRFLSADVPDARPWLWPEAIAASDYVLAARDRADLAERLDEVIEEWQLLPLGPTAPGPTKSSAAEVATATAKGFRNSLSGNRVRLTPILGAGAVEKWAHGWGAMTQLTEFLATMLADESFQKMLAENRAKADASDDEAKPSASDLFFDARMPVASREALWDVVVALVSLMAIQRAYEQRRTLAPWLAFALAERFDDGLTDLLPAIAGSKESERDRPQREALLESLAEEARRSGQPAYYALGDAEGR